MSMALRCLEFDQPNPSPSRSVIGVPAAAASPDGCRAVVEARHRPRSRKRGNPRTPGPPGQHVRSTVEPSSSNPPVSLERPRT